MLSFLEIEEALNHDKTSHKLDKSLKNILEGPVDVLDELSWEFLPALVNGIGNSSPRTALLSLEV